MATREIIVRYSDRIPTRWRMIIGTKRLLLLSAGAGEARTSRHDHEDSFLAKDPHRLGFAGCGQPHWGHCGRIMAPARATTILRQRRDRRQTGLHIRKMTASTRVTQLAMTLAMIAKTFGSM
jgi:hypothetical protein